MVNPWTAGETTNTPAAGNTTKTLIAGTSPNPLPASQQTLGAVANSNIWATGVQAGGAAGQLYSPITQGQQASLFEAPQNVAGVNNSIGGNIQNGFNNLTNQKSPVVGVTTLGNVTGMNAAGINTAGTNAINAAQMQQINALNAQANGQGPSVAAQQATAAGQQNVANEMAMIASQRGGSGNTALGLRSAQNAIAGTNQQTAQNAVIGRTQEELNAQNELTGALGQAGTQTAQEAQAQAALQQAANSQNATAANASTLQQGSMSEQTALAKAQGQMNTMGLNSSEYNAMLQAQANEEAAQQTGNMNYANLVQGAQTSANATAAGQQIAQQANQTAVNTGYVNAGATTTASGLNLIPTNPNASDIRLKTNIKSGTRSMKDFLSKLPSKPSQFNLMSV